MAPNPGNGIVNQRSKHSVGETLEKLNRTLQAKGITVFAMVDHSGEAQKVGLKMRPTKLVIFGSPKSWDTCHARRSPASPSTYR
ncbi:MAG: DUF302 domain-containing protein [Acidobacteriota bacterium]|nr:DUF302 domain-containing protein [Acidobacteriota bacterium]